MMDYEDEEDELLFMEDPIRGQFYVYTQGSYAGVIVVCTNTGFYDGEFCVHMMVTYVSGEVENPRRCGGYAMRRFLKPINYECSIEECNRVSDSECNRVHECICGKCKDKVLFIHS